MVHFNKNSKEKMRELKKRHQKSLCRINKCINNSSDAEIVVINNKDVYTIENAASKLLYSTH